MFVGWIIDFAEERRGLQQHCSRVGRMDVQLYGYRFVWVGRYSGRRYENSVLIVAILSKSSKSSIVRRDQESGVGG